MNLGLNEDSIITYDGPAIIGGEKAEWFSHLGWHVSIQQLYLNKKYHRCDGALISNKWVLSSAYCLIALYTDLYVQAGSIFHNNVDSDTQISRVQRLIIHPNYNPR